ncbi:MAG: ABC transporter permease subunit, partial [Bacillota bacterium]|nr:ABC transporter permease subunit [Bacillota bacterium]
MKKSGVKSPTPGDFLREKRKIRFLRVLLFAVVLIVCAFFIEYVPFKFVRGIPAMGDLLARILRPNFSYLFKIFVPLLDTIEIAVIASFLGTAFSLPLAMLMSKNSGVPVYFYTSLSALFALLRTVPTLIWAAFLVSMFSVGKFSGIAATFIIASLIGTRLLREHIDSISENKILSIKGTGASRFQILRYCILPETVPYLISVFFTVLESCIRSAAVLGLVGAGGIGQILWKDLNSFRYDNIATIIITLFLTIFLIDWISSKIKHASGRSVFPAHTVRAFRIKRVLKLCFKVFSVVFLILLLFSTLQVTGERFLHGMKQGGYILKNLLTPDFSYVYKLRQGLSESLAIAVFATIMGGCIAYGTVALTASNISPHKGFTWFFKAFTNILRTFPPIISAIIFFRGVGPGPYAGALALTIYTAGVMNKLYTEAVESLPTGIIESLKATGASNLQIYRRGIFPESRASFFSLLLYRMESNIRNSTILGMIGAGGIGAALSMNIQWRNWNR